MKNKPYRSELLRFEESHFSELGPDINLNTIVALAQKAFDQWFFHDVHKKHPDQIDRDGKNFSYIGQSWHALKGLPNAYSLGGLWGDEESVERIRKTLELLSLEAKNEAK